MIMRSMIHKNSNSKTIKGFDADGGENGDVMIIMQIIVQLIIMLMITMPMC